VESIGLTRDLEPFREQLVKACRCDLFGLTWDGLVAGVEKGQYLAVNIQGHACAVLEIRRLSGGPALSVVALGGHYMPRWLPAFVEFLKALARDQGCTRVLTIGRPGWVRVLRQLGFTNRMSALTVDV
jgi:hypothetical protein